MSEFKPNAVTKFGSIEIEATGIKTAVIRFRELTVLRVVYRGSMHFTDYGHGLEPHRENPENPKSTWNALSASRLEEWPLGRPTPAAKEAIMVTLLLSAQNWQRENPKAFLEADLRDAKREWASAETRLEAAEENLKEAKVSYQEARKRLVNAKRALES